MTPEPYTVTEDTSLEEVVQLMEKHRIKRLPVVRDKQLVGIVSRANLLHALASLAPTVPATAATDETIRRICWPNSSARNGRRSDFSM